MLLKIVAKSCQTCLWPPGSSVRGISQAQILEWVAVSFSRGIFPTQGLQASPASLALQIDSLPSEPPGKPSKSTEVGHLDTSFEEIPYNLHPLSLMLEIPYNLDPPNLSWFGLSNFLILDSTVVFQKENHKLIDFYLNNVDSIRLLYYI